MKKILVVFLTAAGLIAFSAAQAASPSRPAQKSDLIGEWKMVSVQPLLDKNDPAFFPYQLYRFGSDSTVKFVASEAPLTPEWLDKFKKQKPEINFSVERGLLTMTWNERMHSEQALCAFVVEDVPEALKAKLPSERRSSLPKKGNVTMSFLNSKGKIAYQKILEKVAE